MSNSVGDKEVFNDSFCLHSEPTNCVETTLTSSLERIEDEEANTVDMQKLEMK